MIRLALLVSVAALAQAPPATPQTTPPTDVEQCARAAALADAGEEAEAKKIYVALLSSRDVPCAADGLEELNDEPGWDEFVSKTKDVAKVLAAAAVALAIALLALMLLFVLLTL